MSSSENTIDLEFGLSQLSGNKALFLRLTQKFNDEYQQASAQIQTMMELQQWAEARLYVHTLKGVASNLGFTQLHLAAKQTESELKETAGIPASLPALKSAMDSTISTLNTLQENPSLLDSAASPVVSAPAEAVTAQNKPAATSNTLSAPVAFLNALENNEFIAQEQLESWLEQSTIDESLKQRVRDAIDELDYDHALNVLRG